MTSKATTVAPPALPAARPVGFRRHLRAEVVAGDAAFVFSERAVTAVKGGLVEALAPLLDGSRDLDDLLRELPAGTSRAALADLLARLTDAGLVAERRPSDADPRTLAYWDAAGLEPEAAAAGATAARVALITIGAVDPAAAGSALAAAGLTVIDGRDGAADLTIVLCDDYLGAELAGVDAAQQACGRPWLLAKPGGGTVWIGPVFQPGHGCWQCLATRLAIHRPADGMVQTVLGSAGPAVRAAVTVPALSAAALHLVALEATKWLAGHRDQHQHSVWTFDSLDLTGRHHELRARPQCRACGDPGRVAATAGRPVRLQPRPKSGHSDGSHRWLAAEQVLERYRHLISPVTGIVKEVVRDRRGPEFFTSFQSGCNPAAAARTVSGLRSALRGANGGKGTTPLQAEVGALCEALERYSGTFQGDEKRIRGSLRSLGEQALHPNTCQLYDPRQYAERDTWNRTHSSLQYVCAPFDETAELDWTPVWSMTEGRSRLLLTSQLYFGAPTGPGPRFAAADSNGNAAGSCLEDAVLQGLLEVIERDAVALWWYNRTRAPGVDLESFADPWVERLRSVYASLGRTVWVLDVTADSGVPSMVAVSHSPAAAREEIVFGFGAHLDPLVALKRALSELNQMVPAMLLGGPAAEAARKSDPDLAGWLRSATLAGNPYLVPDPAVPGRRPADYERLCGDDLAADVRLVQDRLGALGLELLVHDQTRPDVGLPVVKVIVPGMRPFWRRYAPGRLFDVPVRLGRLTGPTPYDQLNPTPLFL